jgi:hypothetical protein
MDARVKPAHDGGEVAQWHTSERDNSRRRESGESTYDSGKDSFGGLSAETRDAKREKKPEPGPRAGLLIGSCGLGVTRLSPPQGEAIIQESLELRAFPVMVHQHKSCTGATDCQALCRVFANRLLSERNALSQIQFCPPIHAMYLSEASYSRALKTSCQRVWSIAEYPVSQIKQDSVRHEQACS